MKNEEKFAMVESITLNDVLNYLDEKVVFVENATYYVNWPGFINNKYFGKYFRFNKKNIGPARLKFTYAHIKPDESLMKQVIEKIGLTQTDIEKWISKNTIKKCKVREQAIKMLFKKTCGRTRYNTNTFRRIGCR